MTPIVVWFNRDLRISAHPALTAAAKSGAPVIGCYIWDGECEHSWSLGSAGKWWLYHSLSILDQQIRKRGGSLILRRGRIVKSLQSIVVEANAQAVFWAKRNAVAGQDSDEVIQSNLKAQGVTARIVSDGLIFDPDKVLTKTGEPFRRFTPFFRAVLKQRPTTAVHSSGPCAQFSKSSIRSDLLSSWTFLYNNDCSNDRLKEAWSPGEANASEELQRFLVKDLNKYSKSRDKLNLHGTSRLSPHIHFGEISVIDLWNRVEKSTNSMNSVDIEAYLRQLCWREFSHYLLHHWPSLPSEPLNAKFLNFPWVSNASYLESWKNGQTGYPIIDAALRQLRSVGWIHNRARMVAASFLVKQLLVPWQDGQAWFWETLVDADLANNAASWQWVAGCGVDAAPYFRIFNPVLQGKRYDSKGQYVRKWVPELDTLSNRWIHEPWAAPTAVMKSSGIILDRDYPSPIIELDVGRRRALAAWRAMRTPD